MEKMILTANEAQNIIKKYLEKIIDIVDAEIVKSGGDYFLIEKTSYRGEEVKKIREFKNRSYYYILRLALEDRGYPISFIKEVCRENEEVKFVCFYELVSKRGR